jgi:hypothetical protein
MPARSTVPLRRLGIGLAALVAIGVVLVGPSAVRYRAVTSDPSMRRQPDHQFDVSPSDLLAASIDNLHVADTWPLRGRSDDKTSENWLFPGYVAIALAVVGVGAIRRWRREMVVVGAAGVTLLILAAGDVAVVSGREVALPFTLVRTLVPGFEGVRVPARFMIVPILCLAIGAGFGVRAILHRLPPRFAAVVTVLVVGLILYESSTRIETIRVEPRASGAAVNVELAGRGAGTVVELPMRTSHDGAAWPFVEVSRQLTATIDWHPRVNGHSGFEPVGWPALASTLNAFPALEALDAMDDADVRYVVIRTALPIELGASRARRYGAPGVGTISDTDARAMIEAIPRARLRSVERLGDAYLIELAPT